MEQGWRASGAPLRWRREREDTQGTSGTSTLPARLWRPPATGCWKRHAAKLFDAAADVLGRPNRSQAGVRPFQCAGTNPRQTGGGRQTPWTSTGGASGRLPMCSMCVGCVRAMARRRQGREGHCDLTKVAASPSSRPCRDGCLLIRLLSSPVRPTHRPAGSTVPRPRCRSLRTVGHCDFVYERGDLVCWSGRVLHCVFASSLNAGRGVATTKVRSLTSRWQLWQHTQL